MVEHNLNNSKYVLYENLDSSYTKQFTFTNEEFHSIRLACLFTLSHMKGISQLCRDNLLSFLPDYYEPSNPDLYCSEDCGNCHFYCLESGDCRNPKFE